MRLPLQPLPGYGWLWEVGSPVPPGYSDLLTAARDPFPLAPLRYLVLACLHQDSGETELSTIQENKNIGHKYVKHTCVFSFFKSDNVTVRVQ